MIKREDVDVISRSGLAAVLIIIVATLLVELFYRPMPTSNRDAIMLVIGALLIRLSDVYSYYYGSSVSAARKDTTISTLASTAQTAQAALAPVVPAPDVTLQPGQTATVAAEPGKSDDTTS